jgi:hypothetical protein
MKIHKVDLNTIEVELPAETPAGLNQFQFEIPQQYTTIIALALFVEEQPVEVTDFKIGVTSDQLTYIPLSTKKAYESSNAIAPNEKFLTGIEIPCEKGRTVFLNVKTSVAIPAGKALKFSVITQIVDKEKYNQQAISFER